MYRKWILFGGLLAATVALVGCGKSPPPPARVVEEEHAHKPGAHGGLIVEIGKDGGSHAEVVFARGGVVRLYTLGKDESRVQEVEVQELVGFATLVGSAAPAAEVKFAAEPQPGDAAGKTSLFVGKLPPELAGKPVQVTINNFRVGGERFRVAFSNEAAAHDDGMPEGASGDAVDKLYLTVGGKYTEADLRANGAAAPAVKYKGIKSDHNARPKPGDKICPISNTKANPQFTWVVGGKTYEFCCVPCIDEFVQTAKDKPDEIKDPSDYVKK